MHDTSYRRKKTFTAKAVVKTAFQSFCQYSNTFNNSFSEMFACRLPKQIWSKETGTSNLGNVGECVTLNVHDRVYPSGKFEAGYVF